MRADIAGRSEAEDRLPIRRAWLTVCALALLLAIAFFPLLFNKVPVYDDEGYWLEIIRQFLHHGSLYVHTAGTSYGPFYFSFMGLIYKLTGQNPTLFNGRLLVLLFTALTSGILAATVWRVTRSLPFSILCQVGTFCSLVFVAGNEPTSPGSLIALILSILVYSLVSYSVRQRNGLLIVAGAAVGALSLIKVNVGAFAAAGLVVAMVVGNLAFPRWLRSIVALGAFFLPSVIMFQRLSNVNVATFAVLVGGSMLGVCAVMSVDATCLPARGLLASVAGFGGITIVSMLWPIFTGTPIGAIASAVFIRPLQQVNLLTVLPVVGIQWVAVLITALVVLAVSARNKLGEGRLSPGSPLRYLALSVGALFVFGLGIDSSGAGRFGAWLPAIVILPALAVIADVPSQVRLALRFIIPIAILQVLHAYPVAGSQMAWATFLMFVPASIALSAGMDGLRMWREAAPTLRGLMVGSLCVAASLAAGLWPLSLWVNYYDLKPLNLPGARFVRVDPLQAHELRQLTRVVKANCDSFYSVPGMNSLYIYSHLPTPTGQLANWAGDLTRSEEREVVSQLSHLQDAGKRVCIVRDVNSPFYAWNPGGIEANRPIGRFIRGYQRTIAIFGPLATSEVTPRYSVSIRGQ